MGEVILPSGPSKRNRRQRKITYEKLKEMLKLREEQGLTYNQIGKMYGVDPSTVAKHLVKERDRRTALREKKARSKR